MAEVIGISDFYKLGKRRKSRGREREAYRFKKCRDDSLLSSTVRFL
jgi:hypothetical protein